MSSRSPPPTSPTLEMYLGEEDRLQAFFGQQAPSSPYRSQMPSNSRNYYGPQAPPFDTVPDPYPISSRGHGVSNSQVPAVPEYTPSGGHGGSNSQGPAIPEYPSPDDPCPLPHYPTQYQDPTPTRYNNSPTPTQYTASQPSQAPPPYQSRSHGHSELTFGVLDDPHRPPSYDVSIRSQEMCQYPHVWERGWQRIQQTRDSSSSNGERRRSRGRRRSSNNERTSGSSQRRRGTESQQ